ncbi:hypothetical protein EON65_49010 [archaeon]|nr:MAG: hypothetical protein EON65_49010 [archaeon]
MLFSEFDGNVKIVSVRDPSQITNLIDDEEAYEKISTFCIHPSKNEIVVATAKFSLRHWDLESKTCIRNIKAHKMPILCMEYDNTGTLVATGSADRTVRVWDIAKGYCTHSFTGHTDLVRTVSFQLQDKKLRVLSTSDDASIRIHDLTQNATVAVFNEHVGLPTSLVVTRNESVLISAGRDKVGVCIA